MRAARCKPGRSHVAIACCKSSWHVQHRASLLDCHRSNHTKATASKSGDVPIPQSQEQSVWCHYVLPLSPDDPVHTLSFQHLQMEQAMQALSYCLQQGTKRRKKVIAQA